MNNCSARRQLSIVLFALLLSSSLMGQKLDVRLLPARDWRNALGQANYAALGVGVAIKKEAKKRFVLVAELDANDGSSFDHAVSALQTAGIPCLGDIDLEIRFLVVPQNRANEAKMILAVNSLIYGYRLDFGSRT